MRNFVQIDNHVRHASASGWPRNETVRVIRCTEPVSLRNLPSQQIFFLKKKNKIELNLELCLQFEIYSPDTEFLAIFCNDGLLEVNTFLIDR